MYDENQVTYFAESDARNKRLRFGIKAKDRTRHMYVIGKTGMGKSTLLENLAIQDIQNGKGLAVIDPHGSLAEKILDYVPEHRIDDVLYFAPFDMDFPVAFNVMEDVGIDKRHLVANGLMSAFKKIWVDAWSARMEYILNNTILALLEYPDSTLISVNRMLSDKDYRKKVVNHITDPSVKAFWTEEFANYTERMAAEATPAIQNKIGQFISNPVIRNIIGQPKSTFDFRQAMDEGKIVIVNLSKGRIGEANAQLLGSILVTKIYLAAMSRADANEQALNALPNFYLFVDEFQSFANESFADILSEARKYKLNLIIAHQYIEQMPEEVRSAVFGNVGTMIAFRVGAFDAEVLEKEFAPQFNAVDLVNLGFTQIYLKLMINGVSSQPFSASTLGPIPKPETSFRDIIIEHSRARYAQPRAKVEEDIVKWHQEGRESHDDKKEKGERGQGQGGSSQQGGQRSMPRREGGRDAQYGAPRDGQRQSSQQQSQGQFNGQRPQRPPQMSQASQSQQSQQPNQQQVRTAFDPLLSRGQRVPPQAPPHKQISNTKQEEQERRELELRQAISLSSLKRTEEKEREKKKVMTPENALALRSILGSVLGSELPEQIEISDTTVEIPKTPPVSQMPQAAPEPVRQPATQPVSQPAPKPEQSTQQQAAQQPPLADMAPIHASRQEQKSNSYASSQPQNAQIREISAEELEAALRLDDDASKG